MVVYTNEEKTVHLVMQRSESRRSGASRQGGDEGGEPDTGKKACTPTEASTHKGGGERPDFNIPGELIADAVIFFFQLQSNVFSRLRL